MSYPKYVIVVDVYWIVDAVILVNKLQEILEKSLEKISNAASIEEIENIRIDLPVKKVYSRMSLKS